MTILLTNDDGLGAPGLVALEAAASSVWPQAEIWIVAPEREMSECSHTLQQKGQIRAFQIEPRRWAVGGTPADCVRVAQHALGVEADWVFSGINFGGNMGVDVCLSGTVAAARQAVFGGQRAIAFSHFHRRALPLDWTVAAGWASMVLKELTAQPWPGTGFWNVNLPHIPVNGEDSDFVPERVSTPLERAFLPLSYDEIPLGEALPFPLSAWQEKAASVHVWKIAGSYENRPRSSKSDVDVCFGGSISMTFVAL